MATAILMPLPKQQFLSALGTPLVGGKVYTYAAGTTNPKATYTDAAGTTPQENPIPLNVRGEPASPIYWTGNYRVDVRDLLGNLVYSVDNYNTDPNGLLQLLTSIGSSLLGYIQAGAGAVAWWVQDKLRERVSVTDFMSAAQRADAKAYTYGLDMTDAFTKAVTFLVGRGGGYLLVPLGGYRVDGKAGADAFKDGILIPSTGADTSTRNGIIIQGEGAGTIIRGNSNTMIVVRNARLFSGVRDLQIDGNGKAAIFGYAGVPESIDQTTTFASQSFQTVRDVFISNCTHQIMLQPGPTVNGSDSGAFYHLFENVTTNISGTYDVWFRPDPTGANNRTTRTTFLNCKFLRATNSIYIQAATEIDFVSCWWEMWTGTMLNYVPDSAHSANIRLIGGYGESSGAAVGPIATAPEQVSLIGFGHNRAPSNSEYQMHRSLPGAVNISKLGNLAARLTFGYPGFVDFVADPDGNGQKALEIQTNGVRRERYVYDGSKIFYGSLGNMTTAATGTGIAFSYNGNNVIDSIAGASSTLSFRTNQHIWTTAANVMIATMTSTEFIPRVSNATTNGGSGFLWSSIWAANGAIQTSDPRTKKDIAPTALGMDFIRLLRPVSFRFIVGSNKVIGAKTVKPAVLDEEGREIVPAEVEAIVEPIPGKRLHHGFLTTDVKAALDQLGGVDFGGYVKTDPEDPDSPEALRYDQFVAPLTLGLQQTDKALTAALERIAALEARLAV